MIIGLSGYKGSGKSTIGDALKGFGSTDVISFAGPLKAMMTALFEFSGGEANSAHTTWEDLKEV